MSDTRTVIVQPEWGDQTTLRTNAVLQTHFYGPESELSRNLFEHAQTLERELASLSAELALTTGTLESRERNIETLKETIADMEVRHADEYNELQSSFEDEVTKRERAERERDEAVSKMQRGWLEVTESGINHYKQVAERAEEEVAAQCRLNAMGAEREARLMAENAELHKMLLEKEDAFIVQGGILIKTEAERDAALKDAEQMERRKDAAYLERNQVVSALSKCFPSGVARTAIDGWSEDWHGCVYIDLPTGQVSWHFHNSQAYLFEHLPQYQGAWDGHDTPEKYRRLAAKLREMEDK